MRPRGTGALVGAPVYPDLWPLTGAAAPAPGLEMRVPQAPQKAKPTGTARPQLGQVVPSGAAGATPAAPAPGREAGATRATGGGVNPAAGGIPCEEKALGCTDGGTAAWFPEVGRVAQVPATEEFDPDEVATGAGVGSSGAPAGEPPLV